MSEPFSLVARLTIDPATLRAGLAGPAPVFDAWTDWERLPIVVDEALCDQAREFDDLSPGALLADARRYEGGNGGWSFFHDPATGQLTLVDLLHSDSWSGLIVSLSRLRGLQASAGYILVHDFVFGSGTHAAIGFAEGGATGIHNVDGPKVAGLVADAAQVVEPMLAAAQAGEGPPPRDDFPAFWSG